MRKAILVICMLLILLGTSGCGKIAAVADDTNTLPVASVAQTPPSSDPVGLVKPQPASEAIDKKTSLIDKPREWYLVRNQTHQTPLESDEINEILEQTQSFYVLPNKQKQIYLTFDEGYEMGYTSSILDTLQANHIKAAFFITGHYIKSQPELVKRMQSEGHLVCNHTWNHPDLSQSSPEDLKEEILSLDQEYQNLTGAKMAPYLRPPMGKYSDNSLDLTSQLGYTTVFWSMAFKDWETDNQPGADYSYQHVIDNIHPGAVILLHAVSQSNTEALDRIIKTLKKDGYEFSSFPLPSRS